MAGASPHTPGPAISIEDLSSSTPPLRLPAYLLWGQSKCQMLPPLASNRVLDVTLDVWPGSDI